MEHLKKDLERLADLWDKAAKKGIFDNETTPTKPNASGGFFGEPVAFNPAPGPTAQDSEEWNQVFRSSGRYTKTENKINEVTKTEKEAAASPNPVALSTVGPDSEQIDATFTAKDIEDLAVLKNKLHELQCKFCEFEGRGQNSKKFEGQINTVKKQIDELSNAMTRSFYAKE